VDLRHSDQDEQFRRELRSWLDANLPAEMRSPDFWRGRSDQDRFEIRREWEAGKAAAGFAGIAWPTEYGGRGGTPTMKAIYDEEMAKAGAPSSVNVLGLSFLAPTVMAVGTEEQKRTIIKPLLHCETIWCQGFSEPGAGSDLAALQMRAERAGDEYVLNGQKIWTTNAMHGDKIFTLVRTSAPAGGSKHAGISMLLVDMDQPGVEARPDLALEELSSLAMWSRSCTIWGGSQQVQRTVVAERVLGLPR
jgi:alkylation response protein AidB-like acyl-CoA dehydrogenase